MKFIVTVCISIVGVSNFAFGEVLGTFGPITITATHQPTPQLPGFSTWTVSAIASAQLLTFEFTPYPGNIYPGFGFRGPMNQVNPVGVPTVFMDANSAFPFVGADPLQDSQFLVNSLDVTPADASESATYLGAGFGRWRYFGNTLAFAQIVKPDDSKVTFLGLIYSDPTKYISTQVSGTLGIVPEPIGLNLIATMSLVILLPRRRQLDHCRRSRDAHFATFDSGHELA